MRGVVFGRRAWRRRALRLALLALPALFWTLVFARLAGVGSDGSALDGARDAAQLLLAVACPLLALSFGLSARGREARAWPERAGLAAGLYLLACAVLACLGLA